MKGTECTYNTSTNKWQAKTTRVIDNDNLFNNILINDILNKNKLNNNKIKELNEVVLPINK